MQTIFTLYRVWANYTGCDMKKKCLFFTLRYTPVSLSITTIINHQVFFAHLLKNCSKFPGLTLSQPVNAHFILLLRLSGTRFQAVFVTSLISCNSRLIWKRICSIKLFLIHSSCVFFLVLCAFWALKKILRLVSTINWNCLNVKPILITFFKRGTITKQKQKQEKEPWRVRCHNDHNVGMIICYCRWTILVD